MVALSSSHAMASFSALFNTDSELHLYSKSLWSALGETRQPVHAACALDSSSLQIVCRAWGGRRILTSSLIALLLVNTEPDRQPNSCELLRVRQTNTVHHPDPEKRSPHVLEKVHL
jgi:hypothetical protein